MACAARARAGPVGRLLAEPRPVFGSGQPNRRVAGRRAHGGLIWIEPAGPPRHGAAARGARAKIAAARPARLRGAGRGEPFSRTALINDLLIALGITSWKPVLGMLALPPVPALALTLAALVLRPRRPRLGLALGAAGLSVLWLGCTAGLGTLLVHGLTRPPPALDEQQVAALADAPGTAIVVLGAGRRAWTGEYGEPDLKPLTLERLRYGVWLARRTRLPLAYTGGLAPGSDERPSEAEVAARVARRDFAMPLRWIEDRARDTDENARFTLALLAPAGIRRIVLVTHDFHQQRALAAFARASARQQQPMAVLPAPTGGHPVGIGKASDWMPTMDGFMLNYLALHEWLGWLGGA